MVRKGVLCDFCLDIVAFVGKRRKTQYRKWRAQVSSAFCKGNNAERD